MCNIMARVARQTVIFHSMSQVGEKKNVSIRKLIMIMTQVELMNTLMNTTESQIT